MVLSRNERQVLAGFAICVVVMAVLHEVVQLKELATSVQNQILEDHYVTLKIPPTASAAEITTAFKRATTQLASKKQEGQSQSARINGAYQTLSNPQLRAAYDQERQVAIAASGVVSTALVGIPLLALAYFCIRALGRRRASTEVDPQSFAGRVAAALSQIEASLEMQLQKDATTRLGVQLTAAKHGKVLQIREVVSGGLAEEFNCRDAVTHKSESSYFSPAGSTWWDLPVLRQSDIITSVNGKLGHLAMMEELKSSGSLNFVVKRQLRGGASVLPWLCQAELRRSSAEKWGCEFGPSKDGSDTLEVLQVTDDGSVARWNEAHPELAIMTGDRLVTVDRNFGCEQMLVALRDSAAETSSWLFTRGVLVPSGTIESLPQEVVCGPFDKTSGQKLGVRIGQCLDMPLRGVLLEPQCAGTTVVKEVVSSFLVDQWNQKPGVSKVQEGAVVLAVNGCEDPKQFASELSKPSVKMRLRPPRVAFTAGSKNNDLSMAAGNSGAQDKPKNVATISDEDLREPLTTRVLRAWAPSFAPSSFEANLRDCLKELRCEFTVKLTGLDSDGERIGVQLKKNAGLEIKEISAGGLVEKYNLELDRQDCPGRPRVMVGDRLVSANGVTDPELMVQQLADRASAESPELVFSRPGAKSAPGVWEVEVERAPDEGWGMELVQYQVTSPEGPCSAGVLQVHNIADGSVIDRLNSERDDKQQWKIQVGDLLIACEPEVGAARVLDKLQKVHRARMIMLRWHQGPAPDASEEITSDVPTAKQSFTVTISRSGSEQLGLRLAPSLRDPTRTRVAHIVAGGLIDLHNQSMVGEGGEGCQHSICVGDEIDSVNGEANPGMFVTCCQQPTIVFQLSRRSGPRSAIQGSTAPGERSASSSSSQAFSPTTASAGSSDNGLKMQAPEGAGAGLTSDTSVPETEKTLGAQVPSLLGGSQLPRSDDAAQAKQTTSASSLDAASSSMSADARPAVAKDASTLSEVGGIRSRTGVHFSDSGVVRGEDDHHPPQQQREQGESQPQAQATNSSQEARRHEQTHTDDRTRVVEKSAFLLDLSAIGTLSASLDAQSLEHFNQGVQRLQDLSTAMTQMVLAA